MRRTVPRQSVDVEPAPEQLSAPVVQFRLRLVDRFLDACLEATPGRSIVPQQPGGARERQHFRAGAQLLSERPAVLSSLGREATLDVVRKPNRNLITDRWWHLRPRLRERSPSANCVRTGREPTCGRR